MLSFPSHYYAELKKKKSIQNSKLEGKKRKSKPVKEFTSCYIYLISKCHLFLGLPTNLVET